MKDGGAIMDLFAFFILLTSILSLVFGMYVYSLDKKNKKNIVFLWFSVIAFYLGFVDFHFIQAESVQIANIWLKLGAFWPIAVASIFHFCLEYTEIETKIRKSTLLLIVYVISIAFSLIELGTDNFASATLMQWGWTKTFFFDNTFYLISTLNASIIVLLSIAITFIYAYHEINRKKRISATYVAIAFAIPFVTDAISDTLIPSMFGLIIPSINTVGFFFCLVLIAYTMWSFDLFQINPSTAADNIVGTMQDMLLLTSIDGTIKMVNSATLDELGYSNKKEMLNAQIRNYIRLDNQLIYGQNQLKSYETTFTRKNGGSIPVLLSKSLILDDEKKPVGSVFIAKNITQLKETESKMIKAQKELVTLNEQLDNRVKERTSELHRAHVELQNLNKNLEHLVEEKTEELTAQNQELTAMNQELNALNQQLTATKIELEKHVEVVDELVKQKDEFIHMLGHDLKNPMTSIFTLLPLVEKRVDEPKLKEMVEAVIRSTSRMQEIITETLKLARLDDVGRALNLSNVHLVDAINETLDHNSSLLEKYSVMVENNVEDNLFGEVDKFQFEELITNLLTNAVKYTNNDDKGIVKIDAIETDGFIQFSFSDNGIGMTSGQIEHVFNKFYKAGNPREGLTSSGLGLAICENIVEKHQGKIWAESKGLGKGSTFYFTIPKKSIG